MSKNIEKITSRHVARALSNLKDVNAPKCAIEAVRREFWFLLDDIKTELNKGLSEHENGPKHD